MSDGIGARPLLAGEKPDGDLEFPFRFPLRKAIRSFDEEKTEIVLEEPTADHAVKYGLLTRGLTDETAAALIADLTKVPEASIKRMALSDMIRLTTILSRFLSQAAR
ncbi:phage tail assembly protein [Methylobacterium oryzisoli]|uniref:phage tail assembly protein n=1 Tax=Methylobacterium oryzisoli TaxID=3385502 RepID=UPI003891E9D4